MGVERRIAAYARRNLAFLKRFLWAWNSVEWQGRCIEEMQAIARVLSIGTETAIVFSNWRSFAR